MKNLLLRNREFSNEIRWQPGERLHQLFETRCDQFSKTDENRHLAVFSAKGAWTFTELDDRANQLARYLKAQGLTAGDTIGLLFDKSAESYISMLAVLKIYAAYVPLDPSFPEDRISFIASDAGLKAILTVSPYLQLSEGAGVPVVCIDVVSPRIDEQRKSRLTISEIGRPAGELCYIIYTSGSTGRPKGVPIEHAGICNFVRVAAEVYGYRSSDRVYQGLTIAFDFAVEEIWVPLVVGCTLLPNQTGSSLIGRDLSAFLRGQKATAMCCVPTLLATIDEELPDLRLLIVSGEACAGDLINRWSAPDRVILNAYGPTEATVTATIARSKPGKPVTIGKPLPTYSIVILEPGSEKVLPFGDVGEIAIGGVGVSRGYLNRDDQTRKAFIPDFLKIPKNPSGLIYRTGDLGVIDENGEIEYRGRIDLQVKIRGYRIELTEIESVILQVPRIAQAVVDTFELLPGVKELVAYYTLKSDRDPITQDELLHTLRTRLPGYMVPVYFELLDEMPMMTSDKADRKALPKPSGVRMKSDRSFVQPQNTTEKEIARVLSTLLKVDAVSVTDNFFDDLGANSLLMAQFSSRVRGELGVSELSMREIYTFPSVRKLSEFLMTSGGNQAPLRKNTPVHKAGAGMYFLSGALQLGTLFAWIYAYAYALVKGYSWIIEAPDFSNAYARTVAFTSLAFALSVLIPVGIKWLLVGRWKAEEFPIWSLKYFRFWLVRFLVRTNPMGGFAGSPLYNGYLRLLGARVSWTAFIQSGFPVCTDLFSAGDGAVVAKRAIITGYRAESGRIKTGKVTLERNTFVGESAVLDIDTVMEADSELAHASSLHAGQRLKAGKRFHGSPARSTDNRYRELEKGTVSKTRMALFSLFQLLFLFCVLLPLPMLIAYNFIGAENTAENPGITRLLPVEKPISHLLSIFSGVSLTYLSLIVFGLVTIVLVPRLLNSFLKEGKIYPLFGVHYVTYRLVSGISNSPFYNILFGDSSYIVYFLGAIGYRFDGFLQTGSNFGLSQQHDNPFLSEFGKGSIISDGFSALNTDYSAGSFRLSKVSVGRDCFLGNNIVYPAQSKTGKNCLLGTKVMVPTSGPVRDNVGLLGSPCFEIPRSVRRDSQFNVYKEKEVAGRIKKKNLSNMITMALFLLSNIVATTLVVSGAYYTFPYSKGHEPLYLTTFTLSAEFVLFCLFVLIDRTSLGFRPLRPEYCSIYDEYYWKHERYWKLGINNRGFFLGAWGMLNGTPFKTLIWRLLGVRVGKKVFDDGTYIPEKSLVSIGDYCTLNGFSVLQCHSLEDGIFKSDRTVIGNDCTIGTNSFIHYGVQMGQNVSLEPDSFLMKGESPDAGSVWQGNPAKAMLEENSPPDNKTRGLFQSQVISKPSVTQSIPGDSKNGKI